MSAQFDDNCFCGALLTYEGLCPHCDQGKAREKDDEEESPDSNA